jgi:Tfp pilus assembly protein PilZ
MRKLRVVFPTAAAFRSEFDSNLANGGVFVATADQPELRTPVRVELVLAYAKQSLSLDGEVVHRIPIELEASGAKPGVAVQLQLGVAELRERLAPLLGGNSAASDDRRDTKRFPARVAVQIETSRGKLVGHTRNLSASGALVSVAVPGPTAHEPVKLVMQHPLTGEQVRIAGEVARVVVGQNGAGGVAAVAVHFDPADAKRIAVDDFLRDLRKAEHARRLGGIAGTLEELGVETLIAMFGRAAPAGTLALRREVGEEEAVIGFEKGLMRFVRLGPRTGVKALVRVLDWKRGSFEFHARLDPVEPTEPPLPFEAALLAALQQRDELASANYRELDPGRKLRAVGEAPASPSKIEAAVLELASAGFSLARMLDVIPDPDPEILAAVAHLVDGGQLELA